MLTSAYYMLRNGLSYHDLSGDYFDKHNKINTTKQLVKRLANLGYEVELREAA